MKKSDPPKDGDFAATVVRTSVPTQNKPAMGAASLAEREPTEPERAGRPQTIEDVLVHGEEPTDEFLAEFAALEGAEALSEAELERQALQHPPSGD